MSDVNQAAELTHLRERVADLERERGEILADARVLRAEVEAWREADVRHDLTRHVMGEGEYHAGEIAAAQAATDARGILANPLYQPPANTGEPST